jgi:hypothetical protein
MSNMKVGGRVYRDVEKMNLEQLSEVRIALVKLMEKIAKEGAKLVPGPSSMTRFSVLDRQMKETEQRLKKIDALAKPIVKKETAEKLASQPMALPGMKAAQLLLDAQPAK